MDNLPSAVAKTASYALSNTNLPYVIKLADKGWRQAIKEDIALRRGLGFAFGYLAFKPTAIVQNRQYTSVEDIIEMFEQIVFVKKHIKAGIITDKNGGLFLWTADRPNMAGMIFNSLVAGRTGFHVHNPY